ncbi:BSD domain-containing protein 1-like isoform X2 [Ruditapes philippinarum]|uniref:BSD domain-containing protein 1-like isoform X2 n=1 Tax=Ruditapes philippinarum TaxID=129788 RepID=UPI00295AD77B|nr:BSD domain-containing protein 1-like isoform X2 [Ruditapes philippinarum]
MADSGNNSDGSGGGWWGSFIASAKEKSGKVYEMVSNDLSEFTNTMQADTKQVVEKTKETLKTSAEGSDNLNATDKMKQSFHSLMSGITRVLTVEPEDTSPPKKSVSQPGTGIFDRAKARLRAIQVDTGTYLQEPSGPSEKYADWLKTFDLDTHKGDISELLVTMVEVRSLYTSLVPSEVSHQDFWRRYFYKVHQLKMDEERKQALMKRAERVDVKEDTIDWDDEESWSGDEDATTKEKSSQNETKEDQESRLHPENSTTVQKDKPIEDEKTQKSDSIVNEQKLPAQPAVDGGPNEVKLKQDTNAESTKTEPVKEETIPILEQTEKVISEGLKHITETVKTMVTGTDKESDNSCDKQDVTKSDSATEKPSQTVDNTREDVKQELENIQQKEISANKDSGSCDTKTVTKENSELKTKVKGDMIVVGDRISPCSESSDAKESSNDDWEQDFDVDVTPEDLAAASELAQKMNISASDYSKITGEEEDDWENWD